MTSDGVGESFCGERGERDHESTLKRTGLSDAVQVLLQIVSGPATGRRFRLRQGQVATVGRTEWSDFSVPDDREMADIHFQLQCDAYRCTLRRIDAAHATQRNGEPVEESRVRHGDNIAAGSTVFLVTLEGAAGIGLDDDDGESESAKDDVPPATDIAAAVTLSDPARALLTEGLQADAFLDALIAGSRWEDAVRFLAAWLTPVQSVAWGCECLKAAGASRLTAAQRAALEAAERWVIEPTEEHRRASQAAAEALGGRSPAGWLALAAFWSEGSIGPPDAPEIPAVPGMSARAVGTTVTAVAGWRAPGLSAADALRQSVGAGREMLTKQAAEQG
jgi:hypothetical protein